MTIMIFAGILVLFLAVIMLLVGGIVITKINEALDQDIELGQVNLRNVTSDTLGKVNEMYTKNADWWGTAAIFGMILGLFLSSYFLRNRFPKWAIILDIFIIIAAFIFALYFSQIYQTLLDALASAGETFLEDSAPRTSRFILNLPIFIVIIGVIMMVLSHSSIPRKEEEVPGGQFQGI